MCASHNMIRYQTDQHGNRKSKYLQALENLDEFPTVRTQTSVHLRDLKKMILNRRTNSIITNKSQFRPPRTSNIQPHNTSHSTTTSSKPESKIRQDQTPTSQHVPAKQQQSSQPSSSIHIPQVLDSFLLNNTAPDLFGHSNNRMNNLFVHEESEETELENANPSNTEKHSQGTIHTNNLFVLDDDDESIDEQTLDITEQQFPQVDITSPLKSHSQTSWKSSTQIPVSPTPGSSQKSSLEYHFGHNDSTDDQRARNGSTPHIVSPDPQLFAFTNNSASCASQQPVRRTINIIKPSRSKSPVKQTQPFPEPFTKSEHANVQGRNTDHESNDFVDALEEVTQDDDLGSRQGTEDEDEEYLLQDPEEDPDDPTLSRRSRRGGVLLSDNSEFSRSYSEVDSDDLNDGDYDPSVNEKRSNRAGSSGLGRNKGIARRKNNRVTKSRQKWEYIEVGPNDYLDEDSFFVDDDDELEYGEEDDSRWLDEENYGRGRRRLAKTRFSSKSPISNEEDEFLQSLTTSPLKRGSITTEKTVGAPESDSEFISGEKKGKKSPKTKDRSKYKGSKSKSKSKEKKKSGITILKKIKKMDTATPSKNEEMSHNEETPEDSTINPPARKIFPNRPEAREAGFVDLEDEGSDYDTEKEEEEDHLRFQELLNKKMGMHTEKSLPPEEEVPVRRHASQANRIRDSKSQDEAGTDPLQHHDSSFIRRSNDRLFHSDSEDDIEADKSMPNKNAKESTESIATTPVFPQNQHIEAKRATGKTVSSSKDGKQVSGSNDGASSNSSTPITVPPKANRPWVFSRVSDLSSWLSGSSSTMLTKGGSSTSASMGNEPQKQHNPVPAPASQATEIKKPVRKAVDPRRRAKKSSDNSPAATPGLTAPSAPSASPASESGPEAPSTPSAPTSLSTSQVNGYLSGFKLPKSLRKEITGNIPPKTGSNISLASRTVSPLPSLSRSTSRSSSPQSASRNSLFMKFDSHMIKNHSNYQLKKLEQSQASKSSLPEAKSPRGSPLSAPEKKPIVPVEFKSIPVVSASTKSPVPLVSKNLVTSELKNSPSPVDSGPKSSSVTLGPKASPAAIVPKTKASPCSPVPKKPTVPVGPNRTVPERPKNPIVREPPKRQLTTKSIPKDMTATPLKKQKLPEHVEPVQPINETIKTFPPTSSTQSSPKESISQLQPMAQQIPEQVESYLTGVKLFKELSDDDSDGSDDSDDNIELIDEKEFYDSFTN